MDYVDLLLATRGTTKAFATARPHEIQVGDLVTMGSGATLFRVVGISRMVTSETVNLISQKTGVAEVGVAWRAIAGGAE